MPMHELKKTFEADGTRYRIYQLTAVNDLPRHQVWFALVDSAGTEWGFILFGKPGQWRSSSGPGSHPQYTTTFAGEVNSGAIELS